MKYYKTCKTCGKTFCTIHPVAECCSRKCLALYEQSQDRLTSIKSLEDEIAAQNKPKKMKRQKENLTPSEAAVYLGVSRGTIYNYIKSETVPVLSLPGKTLIRKNDLDRLFKKDTANKPESIDLKNYTTFYEMADKMHLSYNFVREVCHEAGLRPIVRGGVKYFEIDMARQAFEAHDEKVRQATAARRKEYDRRKQLRNKEYINAVDCPHSEEYYSTVELMRIYHLDRNQIFGYSKKYNVEFHHEGRFALYSKKGFDEIFSVTPPIDF